MILILSNLLLKACQVIIKVIIVKFIISRESVTYSEVTYIFNYILFLILLRLKQCIFY